MPSLQERLASVLRDVLPVEEEPDGALTIRHDGTFASLRVVSIVEDLDLVSLTQVLVWDLPLNKKFATGWPSTRRASSWARWPWWKKSATRPPNVTPARPPT